MQSICTQREENDMLYLMLEIYVFVRKNLVQSRSHSVLISGRLLNTE